MRTMRQRVETEIQATCALFFLEELLTHDDEHADLYRQMIAHLKKHYALDLPQEGS